MAKNYTYVCDVPSESNPNKVYTIKIDDDGLLTCNCPSWIFNQRRDRTCKHIDTLRSKAEFDHIGKIGKVGQLPKICYTYPDKCDECKIRFKCFTSRDIHVIGRDDG